LLHAQAIRPLRQVVLGLDTWQLNRWSAWTRPDFEPALLFEPEGALHNIGVFGADLGVLVSIDTTTASFAQLRSNVEQQPQWFAPDGQRLGGIFFREVEPNFSKSPGGYFRAIDRQEIGYMLDSGPVRVTSQVKFGPGAAQPLTSFDYIGKIVSFCRD